MRVQLITHSYLPERTPPQRRWTAFVEEFRAEGWDVDIVVPPADPGQVPGPGPAAEQARHIAAATGASTGEGPWGERIHRTLRVPALSGSRDGRFLGHIVHAVAAIPVGLRAERPDVIVITVPALPTVVAGWTLSRLRRVPLIVEMRDAWPDLARESGVSTGLMSRVMEGLVTGTQRSASLVVAVTQGFADLLRERGMSPVSVVGNGVDVTGIPFLPPRARQEGELHVLYLGNHGESQGLDTVIRAAAAITARNDRVHVRMAGSGTQKEALERLNQSLGHPVEMLDPVHGDRMLDLYAWADTCVMSLRADWPSFTRTIPSKLYELLAIGRHITAAVSGEAAAVLREAGTASIVPLGADSLARLWEDLAADPHRTRVGRSGRDWVMRSADLSRLGETMVNMTREVIEASRTNEATLPRRVRQWAVNTGLTLKTVARHLNDDPAVFALQVSRRLPHRLRRLVPDVGLGRTPGTLDLLGVTGLSVSGRTEETEARIRRAVERRPDHPLMAQYADIAIAIGRHDLAEEALRGVPEGAPGRATVRARLDWHLGHMTTAIAGLGQTGQEGRLRSRLTSEFLSYQGQVPAVDAVSDYVPEPRRILHVLTNSLPHTGSGYAQRSHHILRSLVDEGWDVSAVTRVGWPVQTGVLHAAPLDVVDGIRYHRLLPARLAPGFDDRLQQQADLLLELALQERPALLHTTSHWVNAVVVRAVAAALGVPWVYEVRGQLGDTWASSRGESAYESERYRLFAEREAEAIRSASGLVTLGEQMRDALVDQGGARESIVLCPNAVGGVFLEEPGSRSDARESLGLDPRGEYVGTVSSIVPYEGLETLVRAVARLAPERPALRLLLVGDGVSLPDLLGLARGLGIEDRVTAPGRVDRSRSAAWHQALDVFVVPRRDTKVTRTVTPMKSLEASATGRPVVASDLPALAELVKDGETGLLVPAEDEVALAAALRDLLDDPARSRALGQAGRDWVLSERTWKANARRYTQLYTSLSPSLRV